jgi:hypothetical protein
MLSRIQLIKAYAVNAKSKGSTQDISNLLQEAYSFNHWGATGIYKYIQMYYPKKVYKILNLLE